MARAERAYVSNFDDDTLTIIDLGTFAIIDTIAVGARPIGVAASPDGTRVYVANFGAGSVSVVDTGSNTVIDTIAVGVSANGVAVTSDGALVAVADTAGENTAIIGTSAASVLARVFSGAQPSSIALSPDGRLAFVPNFSTKTVAVIDLDVRLRRAIIPLDQNLDGMVGVAISPLTSLGYVTAFYTGAVTGLDAGMLSARGYFFLSVADHRPEAVAINRAGTVMYVSSHHRDTGVGVVTAFATATQEPIHHYLVGRVPEALALSADERILLAANTGSDSISVIDTVLQRVIRTIEVGTAPMGVAIAGVPIGPLPATPTVTASATQATATASATQATATATASRTPTRTRRMSSPTSTAVSPTATVPTVPTMTPTAPAASCTGDCDGDELVRVDELVRAVRIALEQLSPVLCLAADADASGAVTVDELTRAVNRALSGCP